MRILILSNFYPPYVIGGYGMLCWEVANGLAQSGHTIHVLTSTYDADGTEEEPHIERVLALESDLHFYQPRAAWSYPQVKQKNLAHLRRVLATFQPDIVFVWGMWCLMKELPAEAEKLLSGRVVYYLANPWPIEANMHQKYWDAPATNPLKQAAKRLMRIPARLLLKAEWEQVPLEFRFAPSCSIALRKQLLAAGVPLQDTPVVYEGIDLQPYLEVAHKREPASTAPLLTMLYVGIIAEHKGIHTTIEALALLSPEQQQQVHLTILGKGHPAYEARLHALVEKHQLHDHVRFHQPIPRSELPEFLGRYHVLLLPSTWEEPLARIMQEGLAAGMVVVGSATGGTVETIDHGCNGLLFEGGVAIDLAQQIKRLLDDPTLRDTLAAEGRRTAAERFDIGRMVAELETYLEDVHARAQ